MKAPRKFWIKERSNPQLGTYYVPMGQLSKAAALRYEKSLYGSNYMHGYDTEEEYRKQLQELKNQGRYVQ